MPVSIKSPNGDDVWEAWKRKNVKSQDLEKHYGLKGAVFKIDDLAASEFVQDVKKAALIYFEIETTVKRSDKKGKEEKLPLKKMEGKKFFIFQNSVEKSHWKGPEEVAFYDSIKKIPCKNCNGTGFIKKKCGLCGNSGKGKIMVEVFNEKNEHAKKELPSKCNECFGAGFLQQKCNDCNGYGESVQFMISPVPFRSASNTEIISITSVKLGGMEKELGKDVQTAIENVEGIILKDPNELEPKKIEPQLGFMDPEIKKICSNAQNIWKDALKDKERKISTPVYIFPLISLTCKTRKDKTFTVYSIGSAQKFINFGKI